MNEFWSLFRVRALAIRFLFAAIAFAAFPGLSLANFEAKISPSQLEAGKPIEITITTQNLGLPEGATIDYSVMGIGRLGGMPVSFESTTAQTRPPGYPPVKVAFTIPADFHAGMAMLAVHGLVKDASGAEIGPKDFQLNVVMMGGEAAAPAGPCTATVEPASIELTRDNKPKEVSVQPSANCTESEIRESFAMLGHGINADLCNIKVQKQPDGNYTIGKFTVRANPNAEAPPEGIDWPIGLLGPAPGYKHLGDEDPKVNIKLAGAAAPPQPAEPAVLPVTLPAGTRMLKNRQYGTCLTAQTGRADGSALVLAACGSNADLQTFSFGPHGEIHNGDKCAVLNSNSTEDNTPVVLWTCNNGGQSNEMWTLDSSSRLIGREFKKCLEPNGSDGDNHAAILRPCWNENNQKWDAPVPPPPPVVPVKLPRMFPASSGMLKNAELGTCLTAENDGRNDGTRLVMADCGSQRDAQIFSFGPNGEVQNNGKCAVLSANSTEDNTPILLWTCNNGGQSNEIWTINQAHQLIGRDHQKCIEPNGSDGAHAAILRPCWDGNNQKWNVETPPAPPPAKLAVNFPAQKGIVRNQRSATCLTAENGGTSAGTRLVLSPCVSSGAQIFSFGPNGEIQLGDQCAVLYDNQTADDTPVVLWTCSRSGQANEIWTMDSSSRLIGREHQKCIEPNASDGAGAVVFRPCWTEAARISNQQWNIEQPAAEKQAAGEAFKVTLTPADLTIKSLNSNSTGVNISANYDKPWNAPKGERLQVTTSIEGDSIRLTDTTDSRISIRPSDEVFIHIAGVNPGESTVHFTFTSPSTGMTQTADLKVYVSGSDSPPPSTPGNRPHHTPGGDRPGMEPNEPDPDNGPEPEQPAAAPLQFSDFASAAEAVRAENADLEGLAEALQGSEPVMENNGDAQQIAMLKAYEGLIAELANPGSFSAENAPPAGSDFDFMATMVAQAHARRLRPLYQTASVGGFGLFPSIDEWGEHRAGQRTAWKQYNTVELVIGRLQAARAARSSADVTGLINKLCDTIQVKIDMLPPEADLLPVVKAFGTFSAAIGVADALAKGAIALMPNKVTDLYTVIKGQTRSKRGLAPVDIKVGESADMQVFIVTQSPGGQVMSPYGAVKMVAERILKMKRIKSWMDKLSPGKRLGLDIVGLLAKEMDKLMNRASLGITAVETALGLSDTTEIWKLPAHKSRPIEVDSASVLEMRAICRVGNQVTENCPEQRITIGITPGQGNTSKFHINGVSQGLGGYFFALKPVLVAQIMPEEVGARLNRRAEVNVVDPNKPKSPAPGEPGSPCAWNKDMKRYEGVINNDGKCEGIR